MQIRRFEITIASADNLPNVRWLGIGRMTVYAVVSIDGKSSTTKVDKEGDRNPTWNQTFEYMIDESCVKKPGSFIVVKLYCRRKWRKWDKLIGDEVRIEVKSLYDRGNRDGNGVTYRLEKTEGGTLRVFYRFREVFEPKKKAWKKYLCGVMSCVSILPNLAAL